MARVNLALSAKDLRVFLNDTSRNDLRLGFALNPRLGVGRASAREDARRRAGPRQTVQVNC
jgi:hypothetical protein